MAKILIKPTDVLPMLVARRKLFAAKIDLEHQSIQEKGIPVANPVEYRHVEGRTRQERLDAWRSMLDALDREIEAMRLGATK